MIRFELQQAGKKFHGEWIFRNLNLQLEACGRIGITGVNGSGKSTLLQILSGYQSLQEGRLRWFQDKNELPQDCLFKHLSVAAPYIDLPEEYSLVELIGFIAAFKPFRTGLDAGEIIRLLDLQSPNKPIRHFSSGMKQRVKTGLAILSAAPLLLLDEPLSNMDEAGAAWYADLLKEHAPEKSIVVCSNNNAAELVCCTARIDLADFKKSK